LRNIFDQYSQPENRVTHALMTAIDEDRALLGYFLRELVKVKPPTDPRKLSVLEQQYPGEEEPSEEELERRGIPDGWISDNEGWCVLIESKVIAKLTADQIRRHRRTAERRGFERIAVVAITPHRPAILPHRPSYSNGGPCTLGFAAMTHTVCGRLGRRIIWRLRKRS